MRLISNSLEEITKAVDINTESAAGSQARLEEEVVPAALARYFEVPDLIGETGVHTTIIDWIKATNDFSSSCLPLVEN